MGSYLENLNPRLKGGVGDPAAAPKRGLENQPRCGRSAMQSGCWGGEEIFLRWDLQTELQEELHNFHSTMRSNFGVQEQELRNA